MNGIIYMYTSPSGKQYIGQTFYPNQRRYHHSKARSNVAFHHAVRKYGFENMQYEILHSGINSKKALNSLEMIEIKSRNTLAPNGYNLTTGGESPTITKKSRQRMSDSAKKARRLHQNHVTHINCIETGQYFHSMKTASEKYGVNVSRIQASIKTGTPIDGLHFCKHSDFLSGNYSIRERLWSKRPVQCYETGEVFSTAMDAIRAMNSTLPNGGTILKVLNSATNTSFGYHWVTPGFVHTEKLIYKSQFKDAKRKVECIEQSIVFDSMKSAAAFANLKSPACICTAIKRGSKSGGYHWRYADTEKENA